MVRPHALACAALALLLVACDPEGTPPPGSPSQTATATLARPAQTATVGGASTAVPTPTPVAGACADPALELRVVDKQRGLPQDHIPAGLVPIDPRWAVPGLPEQSLLPDPAAAIVRLLEAAEAEGHTMRIRSTYRSYAEQQRTFQFWIDRLGETQARRESAPAGHSEHQLGTTVDVSSAAVNWELITPFGETPEGDWLAENAHRFGFALSYPQHAEAITGYIWEPWHLRYIGVACATQWRLGGQVLVRFLEGLR
jgi:LAS superfamily LD-carboxypeptidase LdcB